MEAHCNRAPSGGGRSSRRSGVIPSKVFVGNLAFSTTRDELSRALAEAGEVIDVFLPNDRATGRPRGFAFVEFASQEQAEAAIRLFNGRDLGGRPLKVNLAEDRPPRPDGGRRPSFGPPPSGDFGDFGGFGGGFGGGGGGGRPGGGGGPGGKSKGSRRNLRAKKRSL